FFGRHQINECVGFFRSLERQLDDNAMDARVRIQLFDEFWGFVLFNLMDIDIDENIRTVLPLHPHVDIDHRVVNGCNNGKLRFDMPSLPQGAGFVGLTLFDKTGELFAVQLLHEAYCIREELKITPLLARESSSRAAESYTRHHQDPA